MHGGFVACLGGDLGLLDRASGRLRWHRGVATSYQWNGLGIAALVDAAQGPFVELRPDSVTLVHGASPAPLNELQRTQSRFAAITWDGRTLRATRDPLGLAPLFYRTFDGSVWLATEITPLVLLGTPALDLDALTARAAFVPLDERTGWLGIHRVLPGASVEFHAPDHSVRSNSYWSPERILSTYSGTSGDALSEFRERFGVAVDRCFEPRSAILLSGGVDSAAIAVTARAPESGRPHLVHVRFPSVETTDEQHYAAAVAEASGAPLHVVTGDLAPWDIDAELDTFAIPYNRLPYGLIGPAFRHIAANGIAVAIDGHDGDGVLGPGGAEWGTLILGGEWRRLAELWRGSSPRRAGRGVIADFLPPLLRPARYKGPTYMQSIAKYFRGLLQTQIVQQDIQRWRWPPDRWKIRQLQPVLPRALISFEERELEAAQHGIDLRHPFADRSLVEFLISLPCAIKSDPAHVKHLLVSALSDRLPALIHRRPKSDYLAVVRQRVDPARCIESIRTSRVRFPNVDYQRLFDDANNAPAEIPFFLLVNLARVHEFARRAA